MKFEYKHHTVKNQDDLSKLDELGLEGWELISVIPNTGRFMYILKRVLNG